MTKATTFEIGTSVTPADLNRYVAIPVNGQKCPFLGLGHGFLYRWLDGPARDHVRVVSLREPGRARGKRLYHLGDALAFLDHLAANQAASRAAERKERSQPLPTDEARPNHSVDCLSSQRVRQPLRLRSCTPGTALDSR